MDTALQVSSTTQLCHLTLNDFPLRLFFLDKSASMRFDAFTYRALGLATLNALSPNRGSSLTFMLSAPGETQVFFRRPSDPPLDLSIQLGSATWVNEPVLQILQAMAPKLDALNVATWSRTHGEPPLQVVCITDGEDNCSPGELRSLHGLVEAIKEITGPQSNLQMYRPMSDPQEVCRKDDITGSNATQVPVWLCWVAMGSAGQQFLKAARDCPKEIALVDAVNPGAICPAGVPRLGNTPVQVGSVVFVKPPPGTIRDPCSLVPTNQLRQAVVVSVCDTARCTVLYDDDVEETDVDTSRFDVNEQPSMLELDEDCLTAFCLVDAATMEPCSISKLKSSDIWEVRNGAEPGEPERVLTETGKRLKANVLAKLRRAETIVGLRISSGSAPEGFIQKFMTCVGSADFLQNWTSQKRVLGQKILFSTLMQLAQGCTIYSRHLSDVSGDYCGISADYFMAHSGLTGDALETWKEELALPTLQALHFLVAEQVVKASELLIHCDRSHCYRCRKFRQQTFVLSENLQTRQLSALTALCEFSTPKWDALERCCVRYHGPWHRRYQLESSPNSRRNSCNGTHHRDGPVVAGRALRGRSSSMPHIPKLTLCRRQLTDAWASNTTDKTVSIPHNASAPQIEKYKRRNTPMLWGASKANVSKMVLQKSGKLCLENIKRRDESR
jgi:hypothetical protein